MSAIKLLDMIKNWGHGMEVGAPSEQLESEWKQIEQEITDLDSIKNTACRAYFEATELLRKADAKIAKLEGQR